MDETEERKELDALAEAVLENLGRVARAVESAPFKSWQSENVLANTPGKISDSAQTSAVKRLDAVQKAALEARRRLTAEPFVGRTKVEDEEGGARVYYFCRATPPHGVTLADEGQLVSYLGPFGRIAEQAPVGEQREVRIRGESLWLEIVENVQLRPVRAGGEWDAEATVLRPDGPFSMRSLRLQLEETRRHEADAGDELAALLRADDEQRAVVKGRRHEVIRQLGLRDQPVLDAYQGDVFRLPLAKRLMLSGPPGTGKTTTLILRLAQKRRYETLDPDEQANIPDRYIDQFFDDDNWAMFTPTELLKLYLKEAFARWNVAASDERVLTWTNKRHQLARNVLSVLKTGKGGRFTLDDSAATLRSSSGEALRGVAEAFGTFVVQELVTKYDAAIRMLLSAGDDETRRLGRAVSQVVGSGESLASLAALFARDKDLLALQSALAARTDQAVHKFVTERYTRDRGVLLRVAALATSGPAAAEDDEDEDDELEVDAHAQRPEKVGYDMLRRAIVRKAMSAVDGRSVAKTSRTARVLEAFGGEPLTAERLAPLGQDSLLLRHVRFLASLVRNAVDRVPAAYQRFRRQSLKRREWIREEAEGDIRSGKVNGHEVDVVLLTMLRNARTLLEWNGGQLLYQETRFASLESVKGEYRTQVLVDEATDFSVVQLACMEALAHPRFRSFFACGDVRQRVTAHGLSRLDDLRWIDRSFDLQEIEVGYRQTPRLTALASAVAVLGGHPASGVVAWEKYREHGAVPALREHAEGEVLADWLADRIKQVETSLGLLPSIAVFVDSDARIDPLVELLRPRLAAVNLEVAACKEGKVVGSKNEVRVFDIQHIKGLEFEAVFFCGVDRLAERDPDLFDRFLYVGITRSAMYLGVSCEGTLPARLEPVREHFADSPWTTTPPHDADSAAN
jgi:DNA polymerase III delta prime subunit